MSIVFNPIECALLCLVTCRPTYFFQLDYILTVEQFLPSCLKRWFVFSKHQKQVKLGTGHHAIMLMTSMLLGDMRFSMPTVDALQVRWSGNDGQ